MNYNEIFSEIAKYRNMKKEVEKELEHLETIVKGYMVSENITELIGVEHKASYKPVKTTKFESTVLKKVEPEIYNRYCRVAENMRFNFQ